MLVTDTDELARYAESLRRANSDALGWLPLTTYRELAAKGRLIVESENDDPCGFILFGGRRKTARIYQCCIQADARRILHATRLVAQTLASPLLRRCTTLHLRVADDLEANAFWTSIGCRVIDKQRGGKRRQRSINVYSLAIPSRAQLAERLITATCRHYQRRLDSRRPVHAQSTCRAEDRALLASNPSAARSSTTEGGTGGGGP